MSSLTSNDQMAADKPTDEWPMCEADAQRMERATETILRLHGVWAEALENVASRNQLIEQLRKDLAEAKTHHDILHPTCDADLVRDGIAASAHETTAEALDAARYQYLRERVQFDRLIVRRTRVNDHGTTVQEHLHGADLDREIDECIGVDQTPAVPRGEDIVDLLEARGDELSMRAARHIRLKRQSADAWREQALKAGRVSLESSVNGKPQS